MDGHLYEYKPFEVAQDTFDAEVTLTAEVNDTVTVTAKIDFKDPFILITDPGEPPIIGNSISLNSPASEPVTKKTSGSPRS
ncbi:MAG: hypothetical protein ACJAVK_002204 [Akkermansiaceae bacterium]|jgi:hypothetical protein